MNQLLQAYPRLDRAIVEMALAFDRRMAERHGADYDAEELGIGAEAVPTPEPTYSDAPIMSDDQIDRVPCIRPGHPEDCTCAHCNAVPADLTRLTITEVDEHDEQDDEPRGQ